LTSEFDPSQLAVNGARKTAARRDVIAELGEKRIFILA
jgi:hypothetical protein